jgi:hypothetical protein
MYMLTGPLLLFLPAGLSILTKIAICVMLVLSGESNMGP